MAEAFKACAASRALFAGEAERICTSGSPGPDLSDALLTVMIDEAATALCGSSKDLSEGIGRVYRYVAGEPWPWAKCA